MCRRPLQKRHENVPETPTLCREVGKCFKNNLKCLKTMPEGLALSMRNIIPYGLIPIESNREDKLAADYIAQLALQVHLNITLVAYE